MAPEFGFLVERDLLYTRRRSRLFSDAIKAREARQGHTDGRLLPGARLDTA